MNSIRKGLAYALLPLMLLSTMATGLLAYAIARLARTE
jgi:hypothetical protein